MRASIRLAGVLSVALGGCRQPASWPGPAEAVLGGGVLRFLPLDGCARVPIIRGIQGGYHVWGGVRARYVTLFRLKLRFTISDEEGRLVRYPGAASNPIEAKMDLDPLAPESLVATDGGARNLACPDGGVPLEPPPGGPSPIPSGVDGWGETFGITLFMPYEQTDGGEWLPTDDVDGRPVRVRLDLTDADGRTASDERVVVPFYRR